MAPEQARGEIDRVDERADVFGLGAVLCVILTGRPAFTGTNGPEVLEKTALGNLAEAFAGLNACGAHAELIALAKHCLAPNLEQRPRDAAEVRAAVQAYQAGVEDRARTAVAAQARAEEATKKAAAERRARHLTLGLAAAVLLLVVGVGTGAWLVQQQRAATAQGIRATMDQARSLLKEGWKNHDQTKLVEAKAAAVRALEVARSGNASLDIQEEAEALRNEIEEKIRAAEKNSALLAGLLDISEPPETRRYTKSADGRMMELAHLSVEEQFVEAFRRWGVNLDSNSVEDLLVRLETQPEPVVQEIVAGLDAWTQERRRKNLQETRWRRLIDVAERLDQSGSRKELRRLLASSPMKRTPATAVAWERTRTALRKLAREVDPATQPVPIVLSLARALDAFGDAVSAEAMLRAALARHPNEVILLAALGGLLENQKPPRLEAAIGLYRAARAVRPQLGIALGKAFIKANQAPEGETVLRDLTRQQPDNPEIHAYLGNVLAAQQKLDEAVAAYRKAIDLQPHDADPHNNLGTALRKQQKLDEAEAAFRKAIDLRPDFAHAYSNLGNVLVEKKKLKDAIAAFHKAIELKPAFPEAYVGLGNALTSQERLGEAVAAFRKAIELNPNFAGAYYNLGNTLAKQKKLLEAETAFRKAIALKPDYAKAYTNLGNALAEQNRPVEAEAAYRKAIDLRPDDALVYRSLGIALAVQKKLAEAVATFRKADHLLPNHAGILHSLRVAERWLALEKKLTAILANKEKPQNAQEQLELGNFCVRYKHHYATAVNFFSAAFAAEPKLAEDLHVAHRYNAACAAALAAAGKGEDAKGLNAEQRSKLRQRALEWLRADLAAYTKLAEKEDKAALQMVQQRLSHWLADDDLATVRDAKALPALAEKERAAWQNLWADVVALRKKVEKKP